VRITGLGPAPALCPNSRADARAKGGREIREEKASFSEEKEAKRLFNIIEKFGRNGKRPESLKKNSLATSKRSKKINVFRGRSFSSSIDFQALRAHFGLAPWLKRAAEASCIGFGAALCNPKSSFSAMLRGVAFAGRLFCFER
jgi:hypothetical protein